MYIYIYVDKYTNSYMSETKVITFPGAPKCGLDSSKPLGAQMRPAAAVRETWW